MGPNLGGGGGGAAPGAELSPGDVSWLLLLGAGPHRQDTPPTREPHPHQAPPSEPTNQLPGSTQKPRPTRCMPRPPCTDHAHPPLGPTHLLKPHVPFPAISSQKLHPIGAGTSPIAPPTNRRPRPPHPGPAPGHTHLCFLLGGGVASPPGAGRGRWAGLILATPPLGLRWGGPSQEAGTAAQGGGVSCCPALRCLSPASFPAGSAPTAAGLALAAARPLRHLRGWGGWGAVSVTPRGGDALQTPGALRPRGGSAPLTASLGALMVPESSWAGVTAATCVATRLWGGSSSFPSSSSGW